MLVVLTHTGLCLLLRSYGGLLRNKRVASVLQKFLQQAREAPDVSFAFWREQEREGGSPSLSALALAEWKIKIAAPPPSCHPSLNLQLSKLIWRWGWTFLLLSVGCHSRACCGSAADNLWISVTVTHWIHSRFPHIEQFWEKHNSSGCFNGLNSAQILGKKKRISG